VHLGNTPGQREADASPLGAGLELVEQTEDPFVVGGVDADSVVPHEDDRRLVAVTPADLDAAVGLVEAAAR
jgi:hypothetical protein